MLRKVLEKKHLLFFIAIWAVLTLSFIGNIFGVGLWLDWFDGFQKDSSAIIEKTAYCKHQTDYAGPLVVAGGNYNDVMLSQGCNKDDVKPYASQYGLQARIIAAIAPGDSAKLPGYFKRVSMALATLTAFLFTLVIVRIRHLFGITTATILFVLLCLSPWVVGYARNLYWIEPLIVAPFVFSFISYPYLKRTKRLYLFYLFEGVLLFVRLLNGYEYISTIAASALVPIIFYELAGKKQTLLGLWKQALALVIVTSVAFVGAYWMNFSSLAAHYGSSEKAAEMINARAYDRGVAGIKAMRAYAVGNFKTLQPESYRFINRFINLDEMAYNHGRTYGYILVNMANYFLLPAVTSPLIIKGFFGELLQSIGLWTIVAYVIVFRSSSRSIGKYKRPLLWSLHLSLAGALSWLILMPGHALPHAHINGILFYTPLLIFVYIIIGAHISSVALGRRGRE